ncbi:MAG: hypothetical protein PVI09_06170 [Anaerolineae bacterium]
MDQYEQTLRQLTARTNKAALDTLEDGLKFFASQDVDSVVEDWMLLGHLANREWQAETRLQHELDSLLAAQNPELLQAFADEFSHRFAADKPAPGDRFQTMAEREGIHGVPGL